MATYNIVAEIGITTIESILPALGMAVLSICGLDTALLVTLAKMIFIFWVMAGEKDDLITIRISAIVVRFVTAGLIIVGTSWGISTLMTTFNITDQMYQESDSWTTWGMTVVVQYICMMNVLATFRIILFTAILLVYVINAVYDYYSRGPN